MNIKTDKTVATYCLDFKIREWKIKYSEPNFSKLSLNLCALNFAHVILICISRYSYILNCYYLRQNCDK
jgi:hypothetical protein